MFLDPCRIKMQIATELLKVMINFNKNGLVAALIEMAAPVMTAVIINCIGGVKALHETLKICLRRHEKKMKVIIHEDIAVYLYAIKPGII